MPAPINPSAATSEEAAAQAAVEARDLWTFSRDTTLAAPDWLLDETDEA